MKVGTGLVAILVASLAVAAVQPSRSERPKPANVARVSGLIYAVAQSPKVEAWRFCDRVELRSRTGKREVTVSVRRNLTAECSAVAAPGASSHDHGDPISHDVVLLTGTTVAWSRLVRGNDTSYVDFDSAAIATGRSIRSRLPSVWADSFGGWVIAGPASDGRNIVLGATRLDWNYGKCGQNLGATGCLRLGSSSVAITDGKSRPRRISPSTATLVAIGGGRVAFVAGDVEQGVRLVPRATVEVVTTSGSHLGSVPAAGVPVELALSSTTGALIEEVTGGNDRQIEWFNARTFAHLGAARVPRAAHGLGISGDEMVYTEGRRILGLAGDEKKPRILATATRGSVVVGPAVTGKRVLWAEVDKSRRTSSVRTLTFP